MKKILLVLTVAAISLSAMAQTADNSKTANENSAKAQRQEKRKSNLKDLNLTAEQKQQMKGLNSSFRQKMKDLKDNGSITVKEQRERKLSLVKQYKSDRDKLLTAEQRSKLEATPKKYGESGAASTGNFRKASKQLNLTDAQRTQIKTLGQSYKEKTAAIQKNTSLTTEQKKEQISALRKQHHEEMSTLLTKEQKDQLKELRKNRKGQKDA